MIDRKPYRYRFPAYALIHDLLALPNPPTALIALTETQTIGSYRAIRERGLGSWANTT
ncbi:hypothetical protein [Deinococcus hopiensis]|uniref:hypothetical protein n=1 Tax=Deinococcus hopiensis TaxID=309885 RepID=UPI001FE60B3E|nr:hypothetical protein [Deinococcus hopiensis]